MVIGRPHDEGLRLGRSHPAKVVVFVAADGDYITGQQININGGIYM